MSSRSNALVGSAWLPDADPNLTLPYPLNSPHPHLLSHHDRQTTYGTNWMNDNILHFAVGRALQGLVEQDTHRPPAQQLHERIHIFNNHFVRNLYDSQTPGMTSEQKSAAAHNAVRRWTRKFDVFEKSFITFPVCRANHWWKGTLVNPGALLRRRSPHSPSPLPPPPLASDPRNTDGLPGSSPPPPPAFCRSPEAIPSFAAADRPPPTPSCRSPSPPPPPVLFHPSTLASGLSRSSPPPPPSASFSTASYQHLDANPSRPSPARSPSPPPPPTLSHELQVPGHARGSSPPPPPTTSLLFSRGRNFSFNGGGGPPPDPLDPLLESDSESIDATHRLTAVEIAASLGSVSGVGENCYLLIFDSFTGQHSDFVDLLAGWIEQECLYRKPEFDIDVSDLQVIYVHTPQQRNAFDCGFYMVNSIERFLSDPVGLSDYVVKTHLPFVTVDRQFASPSELAQLDSLNRAIRLEDRWDEASAQSRRGTLRVELNRSIEEYQSAEAAKAKPVEDDGDSHGNEMVVGEGISPDPPETAAQKMKRLTKESARRNLESKRARSE
ncbi:hypothetical protein JCM5353_005629 [Sporobolomyces roseus]